MEAVKKRTWLSISLLALGIGIIHLFIGLIYQDSWLLYNWGISTFIAESIVSLYCLYRALKIWKVKQ